PGTYSLDSWTVWSMTMIDNMLECYIAKYTLQIFFGTWIFNGFLWIFGAKLDISNCMASFIFSSDLSLLRLGNNNYQGGGSMYSFVRYIGNGMVTISSVSIGDSCLI